MKEIQLLQVVKTTPVGYGDDVNFRPNHKIQIVFTPLKGVKFNVKIS